jgi:hypothetical protein
MVKMITKGKTTEKLVDELIEYMINNFEEHCIHNETRVDSVKRLGAKIKQLEAEIKDIKEKIREAIILIHTIDDYYGGMEILNNLQKTVKEK